MNSQFRGEIDDAGFKMKFCLRGQSRGFAIIVVLWGIGLISLLYVSFASSARLRVQLVANLRANAQAQLLADSAVNIAAARLTNDRSRPSGPKLNVEMSGNPELCALPGRAVAALTVQDEGGKIDLNGAPQSLIQKLLLGIGLSSAKAAKIAQEITTIRTFGSLKFVSSGGGTSFDVSMFGRLAPSLFRTPLELEQLPGVTPALFNKLRPYVTVNSKSAGFDALVAPAGLLAALSIGGDVHPGQLATARTALATQFYSPSTSKTYYIRGEILTSGMASSVRESIVELMPNSRRIYVREWLRGEPEYRSLLQQRLADETLPPC